MLLQVLANASTNLFIRKKIIAGEQSDIFIYGFEIFYSTLFSSLGIIVLAIIFNSWTNGVLFLLYFMPIRIFAGGYHASTYRRCFILTNAVFLITIVFANILFYFNFAIKFVILLVSIVYIVKHAPIENVNAPLSSYKRIKNMVYAKRCLFIECVSMVIWFSFGFYRVVLLIIATTVIVSLMMKIADHNIHVPWLIIS